MSLKNKRVLLTGGSGFLGRNLIQKLQAEGAYVTNIGRRDVLEGVHNYVADLCKTDFSFIDGMDINYAIHLAAFSSPRRSVNEDETMKLNFDSTQKFFEALSRKNLKKVIFMSSAAIYEPDPRNISEEFLLNKNPGFYALSKIKAEEACSRLQKNGLPIITFRMSNSYGPYQQWKEEEIPTIIPQWISQALINKEITILNESSVRDYIYVSDVCEIITKALDKDYNGVLNLGTGIGTSAGEIANILSNLTGARVNYSKNMPREDRIVLDVSKMESVLDWKPGVSIKEGLSRTVDYYKQVIKI
ncbi:MAG: NAD(P)-dependent oxidoreductase [Nanoarchaeota archaeon]|nr:NAD(P)-dependent oxidoreductase [Nanoarchaeota archaeon]